MLLAALAAIALQFGCVKPAFTDAVRMRYGLENEDVLRVQFYTSDKIVLRRVDSNQQREKSANGLAFRSEVIVEEVVIPAGTPGVAIKVERNAILVSFSREHTDRALWFGVRERAGRDPSEPLRYELLPRGADEHDVEGKGDDNGREYTKGFLVEYGSKKYQLADGKMWNVHLLYEIDEEFVDDVVREKAPGWRLSEGRPALVHRPKESRSAVDGGAATPDEE